MPVYKPNSDGTALMFRSNSSPLDHNKYKHRYEKGQDITTSMSGAPMAVVGQEVWRELARRKFTDLHRLPEGSAPSTGAGVGIGHAGNNTAQESMTKRGGLAGGGKSGDVTSPASKAARGLTGQARIKGIKRVTGTPSIGGSIGRAIPFLGSFLMFGDFYNLVNGPVGEPEDTIV